MRYRLAATSLLFTLLCATCLAQEPAKGVADGQQEAKPDQAEPQSLSVFDLPARFARINAQLQQVRVAMAAKKLEDAERIAKEAVQTLEGVPETLVQLAAIQVQLGNVQEAFDNLEKAVEAGFNKPAVLSQKTFTRLYEMDGWSDLQERCRSAKPDPTRIWRRKAKALESDERNVAMITEENTMWVPAGNVLLTFVKVPEDNAKKPISRVKGPVGDQLREWFEEGTAAGNHGDLYDNHDRGHSSLRMANFPQLTRLKYSPEAKARTLDNGAQVHMLFSGVVMGNSSTSVTGGKFWRSQARLIASANLTANQAYNQFANNHLYLYPEHRDYDPERGDVFFANLPFLIVSQGSSYTDKPFMEAVVATLAAFRPKVKRQLVKTKHLMPAVHMIFRRTNRGIDTDDQYLTGAAHPPVFDSKNLDTLKMIRMAHSMKLDHLPPMCRLRVLRELKPVGAERPERIFDTPAAIARVHRTTNQVRSMVVDASASKDANAEPLRYIWKVLQGDPEKVEIKKLTDDGRQVQINVAWHPRRPVAKGSQMETNRVDVGCFVTNGTWYSPPAIVSTYFPNNEIRAYKDGKLVGRKFTKEYADPLLVQPQGGK